MDDSTKTGGTAVRPYIANTGDWNSPIADSDSRQIRGSLLTYANKQYFAGTGKFREEIPIGTCLIALTARAGWKRWQDGKVVDFIPEVGGHYPRRHDLDCRDERDWPCGPGGKPSDPWQDSREVVLINQDDYTEYTFCTSSGGGRSAVDALASSVRSARLLRPGQLPIVELGWKPMNTSFGLNSKPSLKVVGWWKPETVASPAVAPPDGDLNDPIPDLSK
jgi:hypothetical protein